MFTELTRAVPQMQANSPGRQMAPTEAPTLEDDLLVAASRGQVELLRELLAAGAALHPDKVSGVGAIHCSSLLFLSLFVLLHIIFLSCMMRGVPEK